MRNIISLSLLVLLISSAFTCSKRSATRGCIKGKLVINGICRQLVVQVIDNNIDTSRVQSNWLDASDNNKAYQHVFTIDNVCSYPQNISAGDVFYFNYNDNPPPQECAVCMAYRATPAKHNSISICNND
jgi:hypothetical protein